MSTTIYFIRHSGPFVQIDNYSNGNKVLWSDFNKNMILSPKGEENAKKLCNVEELKNISELYSSNSSRAIETAKYLSELNNLKIKLDDRINEREFGVKYFDEIPEDAENIKLEGATTIYRTNKIIISNPRKITDEMAYDFYKKSNIPELSYYKALAAVSVMDYRNTAIQIFKDKVNKENIDLVLEEWNDFMSKGGRNEANDTVKLINEYLLEVKSDLLISINTDKDPFIKDITNDKVINITGESGSGKSYFSSKYINDDNYIVIDTDLIFGSRPTDDKYNLELREFFKDKEKDYLIKNFDDCYNEILNYFGNIDKTIVIDSAQFRNIKDYSILKGKIIVMRTCIDTCYNRCINRWKNITETYTNEELEKYSNKKLGMYNWYKSLNKFLENINNYKYKN